MSTRWNVSVRSRSNWNLEVLVFKEKGKPKYSEKNVSEQRRESATNSIHVWLRHQDSNMGHIGGRRALSPLRHSCSHKYTELNPIMKEHIANFQNLNRLLWIIVFYLFHAAVHYGNILDLKRWKIIFSRISGLKLVKLQNCLKGFLIVFFCFFHLAD